MTKALYYDDSYLTEFDSTVVACLPKDDRFRIELQETVFYPEGGGEPGDLGTLNEIPVLDTIKEKNGTIYHIVATEIPPNSKVHGKIDWVRRYDLMQFHTAQHLISSTFWDLYKAETISVHVSEKSASIDLKIDSLNWEMVDKMEQKANTLIYQNLPVIIHWIKDEKILATFPLRRTVKKSSERGVRIVEIEKTDYSACGGMHLKGIGEIGLLKVHRWSNFKNGVQVEFLFGTRALRDYSMKNKIILNLMKQNTCQDMELEEKIAQYQADITRLRNKNKDLFSNLLEFQIPKMLQEAPTHKDVKILQATFENLAPEEMKKTLNLILATPNVICLLATLRTEEKKIGLTFAHSVENPPKNLHMGKIIKEVTPKINGKGGGRPQFAQGGGTGDLPSDLLDFAQNLVKKQLD
ncbi:MAG: alanyl-tRNA editing protein [Promethearchaeota archaeon]